MSKGKIISIEAGFDNLRYLENRTPDTTKAESADAFGELAEYRDGAIFIAHYAGFSEWERHPEGDEIVYVVSGKTNLILLSDIGEVEKHMGAGDIIVVPKGQWHRFKSPEGVKIMSVTPQPTDHCRELPTDIKY